MSGRSARRSARLGPIELGARREGERLVLTVRDHGPGVAESELPMLFEPFYRSRGEMARQTRGAGLGLAIVRGLVGQLGGEVSARNHAEGGLVVEVRLKCQEEALGAATGVQPA